MQEIQLSIIRGFLDNRKRQLILNPEFIKFEEKEISGAFTQFSKNSIIEYRYGINWINGIEFTIGREYQIFIHNLENDVLKINFKSFYGFKKKEYHRNYSKILDTLWDFYFSDISWNFINKFQREEEFKIGNVGFSKDNITIGVSGILKEESKTIPWESVRTRDYQTYFAIYSIDDPINVNRGYSYLDEWNTGILYSVVKSILDLKRIEIIE
jgi:hypothetical protein